jgi:hypothetical protein
MKSEGNSHGMALKYVASRILARINAGGTSALNMNQPDRQARMHSAPSST